MSLRSRHIVVLFARAAVLACVLECAGAEPSVAEDGPVPHPSPVWSQIGVTPTPDPNANAKPAPPPEEENGSIQLVTPTPDPASAPMNPSGEVEPLDPWYVPAPRPGPSAVPSVAAEAGEEHSANSVDHGEGEEEEVDEESEEEEEDDEGGALELESVDTDAQLPEDAANKAALDREQRPRRIQLNKSQRRRIELARKLRSRVMREQRKSLGLDQIKPDDPRGDAELRVCSLNLNNYGPVEDYRRIFKTAKLPVRLRIEASSLRVITAVRCDIVAVQSLLGISDSQAQNGLEKLAKKLTARTSTEWEFYIGKGTREIVRNGFLYRKDVLEIKRTESFDQIPLTHFGQFSLIKFLRAPIIMVGTVKGKNHARNREIVLMNYHFRNAFVADKEPEQYRMQMADAIRQIVHTEEDKYPKDNQPIFVLLGDRMAPQHSPSTQLLEGRSRLIDFTLNGGCTLTPENKVECKNPVFHFKEFFGVTAEGYLSEAKLKKRKAEEEGAPVKQILVYPPKEVEKKLKKPLREKTVEIYLRGEDLPLAHLHHSKPGRYQAGIKKVGNGLPTSPLAWVELNW